MIEVIGWFGVHINDKCVFEKLGSFEDITKPTTKENAISQICRHFKNQSGQNYLMLVRADGSFSMEEASDYILGEAETKLFSELDAVIEKLVRMGNCPKYLQDHFGEAIDHAAAVKDNRLCPHTGEVYNQQEGHDLLFRSIPPTSTFLFDKQEDNVIISDRTNGHAYTVSMDKLPTELYSMTKDEFDQCIRQILNDIQMDEEVKKLEEVFE